MTAAISQAIPVSAESIPYTHADEAQRLMTTALERFLHLIESLAPQDWHRATPCTAWDVHDMVAHQAGGYASGASYREMLRQYMRIPRAGQLPEDAINALQVGERKDKSPDELVEELKHTGPRAIHNWAHGFRLSKWISIPHPVGGMMSVRDLMWVTHSRDTWMHRLDGSVRRAVRPDAGTALAVTAIACDVRTCSIFCRAGSGSSTRAAPARGNRARGRVVQLHLFLLRGVSASADASPTPPPRPGR